MGYEVFDREVEEDRPPAGTPCCVCRTMGHWCQAEVWTAGDSGNGICRACVEGRDCSVVAVKRKKEVPFEAEPLDVPVAAVKVERMGVIELPAAMERLGEVVGPVIRDVFEIPAVTKDEKAANRRQMIADMLIEGKTVNQISHELNFSERVILDVKAGIPSGKLPKRGRPAGTTYKNEQRSQAAELLKNGSSVRDTATAVGLARGTIQEVRHEIGVTEKANNGGGDFQKQRFGGTIGRLLQLKAGETIALGAIEGLTLEEFAEDLKYELKHHPKTSDKRWLTKVSDGRIIAGWMPGNELRLSTERAPKSPQRPIIKNLIGSGVSVRSAAEIAGVSTNTVQTVKREMREEGIPLFVSSNSPVSQGKRSTYIIPAEVRKQIAEESPETDNQVLATKYGCSRATVDNIRKEAGIVTAPRKRGPEPKQKTEQVKEPVSPQQPVGESPLPTATIPAQDITLSRAFEMVIREVEGTIDICREVADDDPDSEKANKNLQEIADELRGWHPAVMRCTSDRRPCIYEQAMNRAEAELHIIKLESRRLSIRGKALEKLLATMKAVNRDIQDTQ